jgi:hypothetical protein
MYEHLKNRGMTVALYPYAGIDNMVARFPMYDFGGRMTGFQQYRRYGEKKLPNDFKMGKYAIYVAQKQTSVFGLESFLFSHPIFLVGGMFKAATLHRLGYTALHVSAVSPKSLLPQLQILQRPFFAIGDNDLEGAGFVNIYGGWQSPIDVDEMPDSEVHRMIDHFSFLNV